MVVVQQGHAMIFYHIQLKLGKWSRFIPAWFTGSEGLYSKKFHRIVYLEVVTQYTATWSLPRFFFASDHYKGGRNVSVSHVYTLTDSTSMSSIFLQLISENNADTLVIPYSIHQRTRLSHSELLSIWTNILEEVRNMPCITVVPSFLCCLLTTVLHWTELYVI